MVKKGQKSAISGLILALEFALMVLITFLLVRTVIAYTTPESLWDDLPSTVIAKDQNTAQHARNYNTSFDPFFRSENDVPIDLGQDAPETSLNLKLTGMNVGERSTAILQTPDNQQRPYQVGEEIISGVTLHSVTPDYVVLSLNGRLERLTYTRDQPVTLSRVPTPNLATSQSVFDYVNLTPVRANGQMQGFRITPKPGGFDLSAVGLESGDIVTRINSTDLTSGLPNLSALQSSLNGATSVTVTLLRNGRTMTKRLGTP